MPLSPHHDIHPPLWRRGPLIYLAFFGPATFFWGTVPLALLSNWSHDGPTTFALITLYYGLVDFVVLSLSIIVALIIVADSSWPARHYRHVLLWVVCFGLSFTLFGQWEDMSLMTEAGSEEASRDWTFL